MFRDKQGYGFFLTPEQIDGLKDFSVNLLATVNKMLETRNDFTLEELLNKAFAEGLVCQANIW